MKSTTTVYGASNRDPAMFTEDMEPRRAPRAGYAKDVAEIEGYVRGFARRRPDVRVTMLRCANVIGAHVVSPLTSYFRLPVVPTRARVRRPAAVPPRARPARRAAARGRQRDPRHLQRRRRRDPHARPGAAPAAAADRADARLRGRQRRARCCARPGSPTSRPSSSAFLTYGRGVDTTRMRDELGFEPSLTTAEAFADFATSLTPTGGRTERVLGAAGRARCPRRRPCS